MLEKIIEWSSQKQVHGHPGDGVRHCRRDLCPAQYSDRCHPRSLRCPGHRLHRVSGPGAAGGRGPGHLSAHDADAGGAAAPRSCAATPFSACPSSTSSLKTAPICTGPAPGCSNTSTTLPGRLPQGVTPSLGPDATGVGWVYEYVLESDRHDLQSCVRSRTGICVTS